MRSDNMPELPPKVVIDTHLPTGYQIHGYAAEQMHAYARQYAAQENAKEREANANLCANHWTPADSMVGNAMGVHFAALIRARNTDEQP